MKKEKRESKKVGQSGDLPTQVLAGDYIEFLIDYREYFEKVKRDYKERSRVKKFQGYLDFERNIRKL